MMIKALTTVRMNAVLDWEVKDTANLDMGTGKFAVPEALRYFNKMERRVLNYNMRALNNTNVFMNVYALVAPYNLIHALDTMSVNESWQLIADTALAKERGFVSFLGTEGVKLPPRGEKRASDIALHEDQIATILGSDTCGWRWQARFLPKPADALHDTDYIDISSWMHLEGDNNMDSLLIWKNND